MIVTHGGITGGYGLYLRDGRPTFVYNFLRSSAPPSPRRTRCPKARRQLVVDFVYDGGGMGKGGDDHHVGQRQEDRRRAAGADRPDPVLV